VDLVEVKEGASFETNADATSFVNLLVTDGEASVTSAETKQTIHVRKGESLFIPAGTGNIKIEGTLQGLLTRIP
jgi:mannose-6-phosphate isomerase